MGVVRVEDGVAVQRARHLVRPPRCRWQYSGLHGIGPDDVAAANSFGAVWSEVERQLDGVAFVAAHNAAFERRVLRSCCEAFDLRAPAWPVVCTMQLARERLGIRPTALPLVCQHLGIPLRHHDPLSDAHAVARIVLAAIASGWSITR